MRSNRFTSMLDGVVVGWLIGLIEWFIAVRFFGETDSSANAYITFAFLGALSGALVGLLLAGFIRDNGIIAGAIIGFLIGVVGIARIAVISPEIDLAFLIANLVSQWGYSLLIWSMIGAGIGVIIGLIYQQIIA